MPDNLIKLPANPSEAVIGFYLTDEGRKFLKFAYRRYLDQVKAEGGPNAPSHGSVAREVADWNQDDQLGERDRTAQTLRRWSERDQRELWLNETEKNLRVFERLESYLMKNEKIAQLFLDRAAPIRSLDFCNALSLVFYGPQTARQRALLRQSLQAKCGIFEIWKAWDGGGNST